MADRIPSMPRSEPPHNEGFALVAVLAFLMMFAMFLAPFVTASKVRALTVSNRFESMRLDLAAQAINDTLSSKMSRDPSFKSKLLEASRQAPQSCKIRNITLTTEVLDQSSLIDLNRATPELIALGLESLGLETHQAAETAQAMVSFRSFARDAQAASRQTPTSENMKHGPFESVVELHEFAWLQPIPLDRLARLFTLSNPTEILTNRSLFPDLQRRLSTVRASESNDQAAAQDVVSLTTTLQTGGGFGSDYQVVVIDNVNKTYSTQITMRLRQRHEGAASVPCAGLLGTEISAFAEKGLNP
ncbi:hypothetical protein IB270_33690 [Ensifer sp. ENS05]|uniref:hypothetical protein n=1 Tax=Ensifer sp. ENS05 TaxID=2769277 RepID=UPI0017872E34|nr:hypothetical protein [Ensifer sp. ENS05]MBD9597779.1 hypothetical protein [Ensifer sp. ENS05]